MAKRSKPLTTSDRRPKIASAARRSLEPRRAGALRVSLATTALVGLAAGGLFFGSRWVLQQDTLRHLEELRNAARQDFTTLLDHTERRTLALANEPATAAALTSLREGVRLAATTTPDQPGSSNEARLLVDFYKDKILPAARATGHALTLQDLLPDLDTPPGANPTTTLQARYLAATSAADRDSLSASSEPYARAHELHDANLKKIANTEGWENLHLIDHRSGNIVYSTQTSVETFTSLTEGPHRSGGLAHALARTLDAPESGETFTFDARSGPIDDRPRIFVAAPVFAGATRLGTVIATIDQTRIDEALLPGSESEKWIRADLGTRGQILAIAGDGALRSTPRRSGASPNWESSGLREALAGRAVTGPFESGGETILASYAPVPLGDRHWVIAAEQPRQEVLTPLSLLLPAFTVILLLSSGVGWLVGARLWEQFAGRIRQITRVVHQAQRGDRKVRLEANRSGAIGELTASINRLLEDRASILERSELERINLDHDADQILEIARAAAAGDPVGRADINDGSLARVSTALNEMLDTIGVLSESLLRASSQVCDSATEIRAAADESAHNATRQSEACNESEGSAETLRSEGTQITERCSAALETARRTEQASRQGKTALEDLLSGMDGLQKETRAATVKIKRLGERSMQISAIIGTISKMSAQTDMLALNAAIEASRAGEQGQGFTLVADEVRKLAERAAAAAKEIERLISGIQSDIGDAIAGMERQGERLDVQAAAAVKAQSAIEQVGSVTQEATSTVEEIASTAGAQAAAVDRLGLAVSEIASAATDVQRSSELTRRSTTTLSKLSEELRGRLHPVGT